MDALRSQLLAYPVGESHSHDYPSLTAAAEATGFELNDRNLARYLEITRWQLEVSSAKISN